MNPGNTAHQVAATEPPLTVQNSYEAAPPHAAEPRAQLVVKLTQLALSAPDIPSAVMPALEALVERTAAAGSAYFQIGGGMFRARSASGVMPQGPIMEAILAHGLPAETPLMYALEASSAPLFFDDTSASPEAAGFPELGVASLAAAPVLNKAGVLQGAFLMHTFEAHRWGQRECDLFGAVAATLAALAARLVAEEEAIAEKENALQARESAIKALGIAVESRDAEVKGHTDRVTDLAIRVGEALGLDGERLEALRWGAYLHDLGKVATPDAILHKPGRLSPAEWEVMRRHVESGHKVALQLPFLPKATLETILYHHERWDGGGYPHGLAGAEIPLAARIFSVCDVYDALTSVRPYKAAWTHEAALAEIQAQAGSQFDPEVVRTFNRLCQSA
jgi:putative nucleotidyltransferase with HDIG domain